MVYVETRALGRRTALIPEWSVPLPPNHDADGDGGMTLADLIERVVRDQVQAFRKRQDAQRFVRALSQREIEAGAQRGKIDSGGRELGQEVDAEQAVASALQGFEDGLYLVLLDGTEQKQLQQQVYVTEQSRMIFLRLAFLAGG